VLRPQGRSKWWRPWQALLALSACIPLSVLLVDAGVLAELALLPDVVR